MREYGHRVSGAVGQRIGERCGAVGRQHQVVGAVVLQRDRLAGGEAGQFDVHRVLDGVGAGHGDAGHVGRTDRAAAVADRAGLGRGLGQDGDGVRVVFQQFGGEGERAVGRDAEIVAAIVSQHQRAVEACDRAADAVGRYVGAGDLDVGDVGAAEGAAAVGQRAGLRRRRLRDGYRVGAAVVERGREGE